jgi:hypothetical protein
MGAPGIERGKIPICAALGVTGAANLHGRTIPACWRYALHGLCSSQGLPCCCSCKRCLSQRWQSWWSAFCCGVRRRRGFCIPPRLARLALEGRDVKLPDLQLAAGALVSPRGHRTDAAEKTLLRLL